MPFGDATYPMFGGAAGGVPVLPPPPSILIPASARLFAPASSITTAGGVEGGQNSNLRHRNNTGAVLTRPRVFVYRAGYDAAMSVIRTTDNVIEFRHSLDLGTRYQFLRGGSADILLATTDDYAFGDPLDHSIPAGSTFGVRGWQHIPASTKYVGGGGTVLASLGEFQNYAGIASQPDRTMSGTNTGSNGGGPNYLVFAEAPAGTASTLVISDSIDAALNETAAFTSDANGHIGPANRWLASKGHNSLNLAKPSSRASQWVAADKSFYAAAFAGVTFYTLWIGLGRNDYAANRTSVQIKADVEAVIAWAKAIWPSITRVIVRDLPPTTTGDWTTVEGQADRSGASLTQENERIAYNAIVAAKGITGQTDYFALAPAVQTTKSSGQLVWKAGYTNDGIHPLAVANVDAVTANAGL